MAPLVVIALVVVPVAIQVVHAPAAKASSGTVLILSTSVDGGADSAEAEAVPSGYTVTVDTATEWDALTEADFEAYSAIIIGDPSADSTCSSTVPAAALSDASTWGAAVTAESGHVAVLGTAPALAGSSGTALMKDAIAYALSGSGTGLYVSLNCEYASASAGTSIPLLADVYGGDFEATGQSSACQNSGTVNRVLAESVSQFSGLTSGDLASWASPACSVEETLNAWPSNFSGLAYDSGVTPADFTASDGATGQPYVLLGAAVSSGTLALSPSTGGEVADGAKTGGSNASDPGLASSQVSAADPVDPETGDFTQSDTDLSVPGYGPSLGFTRTYDAALADEETKTGTPGALGYGWTDNYATSLTSGTPVSGDIYTIDGKDTYDQNGSAPAKQQLDSTGQVMQYDGDTYIADSEDNRIEEIAGATETEWGISMTAGDMYTVAGSQYGTAGESANGAAVADTELDGPAAVAVNSTGMYIADTENCRVTEIPSSTGTQWGISMTADEMYTIGGESAADCGVGSDGEAATSSELEDPEGLAFGADSSADSLFISDSGNNRVQELADATGTQWGQSMTKDDIYTVMGVAAGTEGTGHTGHAALGTDLDVPIGISVDSGGNLYVADSGNCRVLDEPAAAGSAWGYTMTADYTYPLTGEGDSAVCGTGADGTTAVSQSSEVDYPSSVAAVNGNVYVADSGNNRIQEIAGTTHTERDVSMTADYVYTVAGSSAGDSGSSGDGSVATSALLDDPEGIWADSSDDLYISDSGNNVVRKVSYSTYEIAALAGTGGTRYTETGGPAVQDGLFGPEADAVDAQGDVFIADTNSNRIEEIASYSHTQFGVAMTAGDAYTVAGSTIGTAGHSGDGGAATSALLDGPSGVALDSSGDLFIADWENNRIQEVSASTGDISTVAGSSAGTAGHTGDDAAATSALLDETSEVAVDSSGDLYIADSGNNRVQEVAGVTGTQHGISMTKGDIYTIAGSSAGTAGYSGIGGAATSADLEGMSGLAIDSSGNVYITDATDDVVLEVAAVAGTRLGVKMTASDIYLVAGDASAGHTGDGGKATSAELDYPMGVAVDSSGDLYIGDTYNSRIQEVAAANGTQWGQAMTAGHVYTVAGSSAGTSGGSGDGGAAASAKLDYPVSLYIDNKGDLFIPDEDNNLVREVVATANSPIPVSPSTSAYTATTVTQSDGSQVTFYPETSSDACTTPYTVHGGYCALPQYTATLTYSSATGDYTFTPSAGTTDTYSSAGVLLSEADAAGNTLTMTYGSPAAGSGDCPSTASTCDTVTAADGRELVIGLTDGLVTTVTDPLDRTWTYAYNSDDDLTSVTDPLSRETKYTYGDGSTANALLANDLLTITKPAGGVTTNTYDNQGRVITQTDPMGYETTFDYSELDTATGDGVTAVTDGDGYTTAYDYDDGVLAAESKWDGTTLVSETDYGPDTSGGTLLDSWTADGDGDKTTYTYNSDGDTTSTTDASGDTTTSTYTSDDDDSCDTEAEASATCSSDSAPSAVSPGGAITVPTSAPPEGVTYTLYDTDGNKLYTDTGVYEPGSSTASYEQVSYTLYKGNTVTLSGTTYSCTYTPPSQSLPCATISADGTVTQKEYDSYGDLDLSSVINANGSASATTTYTYDADGEQLTEVSPDGNASGANAGNYTTTTAYNADGEKTTVSEGDGSGATVTARTTTYGYDADGNQTTVEDARGYTTTTTYNLDDQASLVANPYSNTTLTCYDGDGNKTETVLATGVAGDSLSASSCPTSYPTDYGDRLASDATTYTYNADGDETAETTPAPAGQSGYETTTYDYDSAGNLTETIAPPSSDSSSAPDDITYDTYDSDGKLSTETTGYGTSTASTTVYCYDTDGNKAAIIPGDGNASATTACGSTSPYETTYTYDSADEMVSQTTPDTAADTSGGTTTYTYDDVGNELTTTDPAGVTTTYTYDPAGNKTSVTYSGSAAHSVTYSYDVNGNKTAMTDASGTSSYTYDSFNELTSTINGDDQAVSYSYDSDGDVTGITYPLPSTATWASTHTISYGYDNADRLSYITDFNGNKTTFTDNGDNLVKSSTFGSTGDTLSYSYDSTDANESITLANSSGTTLQSFAYSDAPDGSILAETDSPTSAGTSKSYTYTAQDQVSEETNSGSEDYSYDDSGDLTGLPDNATGSYDDDGELTSSASSSGTVTDYTYNADGERTSATSGGSTTESATWNGAGELTSYDDSSNDMTGAIYDGDGLRTSTTISSGGTESYIWNTLSEVPQMIMDGTNAYIYTSSTAPVEQVNLSAGTVTYLVADSLGSVRGTVNSSGALTGSCTYDAYGNPLTTGGLTSTTPFGYAGSYTDTTGLIYLENRYYDSTVGQYLSVDPMLIQTQQPYSYVDGNPVDYTDPDGEDVWRYCYQTSEWTRGCLAFYDHWSSMMYISSLEAWENYYENCAEFFDGLPWGWAEAISYACRARAAEYRVRANIAKGFLDYCGGEENREAGLIMFEVDWRYAWWWWGWHHSRWYTWYSFVAGCWYA